MGDWLLPIAIVLGMFILRLGVPLAVILTVGYLLRRLDAKWQAEAQAQRATSQPQQEVKVEPMEYGDWKPNERIEVSPEPVMNPGATELRTANRT